VPTHQSQQAYSFSTVPKQPKNPRSLANLIDRLEWMREEMLSLQRQLERLEVEKRDDSVVDTERRQL
jgi:hypothetical protein